VSIAESDEQVRQTAVPVDARRLCLKQAYRVLEVPLTIGVPLAITLNLSGCVRDVGGVQGRRSRTLKQACRAVHMPSRLIEVAVRVPVARDLEPSGRSNRQHPVLNYAQPPSHRHRCVPLSSRPTTGSATLPAQQRFAVLLPAAVKRDGATAVGLCGNAEGGKESGNAEQDDDES
jgi:hypothetical protein